MKRCCGLIACGVACHAINPSDYTATPHGYVLSHCVHDVPSGTHLTRSPTGGLLAMHSTEVDRLIPVCDAAGRPMRLSREDMVKADGALPADYDGWTFYTAFENKEGFDSFVGDFSVPTDLPAEEPQILFIFPALQNEDWIPKHDPEPITGFDIIQPVLQYPGDAGRYWSVKSWYVTTDIGTVSSSEIKVTPGDVIFGNMTRTGASAWYIDSVVKSSGKHTSVSVDHPRLKSQPWAYNTIECYGCTGCRTYPTAPCLFTNLQMSLGGQSVTATWLDTPKKPDKLFCKEAAIINGSATVTFSFA